MIKKWIKLGNVWEFAVKWGLAQTVLKPFEDNLCPVIVEALKEYTLLIEDRSRARAGFCDWQNKAVRMHIGILMEGHEKIRDEVFLHEVAHIVAALTLNDLRHGAGWKATMQLFGLEPIRNHFVRDILEAAIPNLKRVSYGCQKCTFVWLRSRKLPRGRRYKHKNCGGIFKLIPETKETLNVLPIRGSGESTQPTQLCSN